MLAQFFHRVDPIRSSALLYKRFEFGYDHVEGAAIRIDQDRHTSCLGVTTFMASGLATRNWKWFSDPSPGPIDTLIQ